MQLLARHQGSHSGWYPILVETLLLAAYTLLCLFIFQPFGTHEYTHPLKILQLAGYGVMVLAIFPFSRKTSLMIAPRKNSSLFLETLRFTCAVSILSFTGFFYHAWTIEQALDWSHLPTFLWLGTLFWLLPVFVFVFYKLVITRQQIPSSPKQHVESERLHLKGSSPYESFYFQPSDIFYLQSSGNYVTVYFRKEGAIKSTLIRNTLNQVSGQLPDSAFANIHRSFIVNLKLFDKVIREEGKHLLINQQFNMRIPVSRNKVSFVEEKLNDHS